MNTKVVSELELISACSPGCEGRCAKCPREVIHNAIDYIYKLEKDLLNKAEIVQKPESNLDIPEEELRLLIWWATCGHGECDPTKLKDAAEKVSSYMFSITRGMK